VVEIFGVFVSCEAFDGLVGTWMLLTCEPGVSNPSVSRGGVCGPAVETNRFFPSSQGQDGESTWLIGGGVGVYAKLTSARVLFGPEDPKPKAFRGWGVLKKWVQESLAATRSRTPGPSRIRRSGN